MTSCPATPKQYRLTLGVLLDGLALPAHVAGLAPTGLCLDSRRLSPGDLFMATAGGGRHGLAHVDEAVQRGCLAVVYDPAGDGNTQAAAITGVPAIALPELGQRLGDLADRFYQTPSRDLTVVGVTGTNGKTSCTHFLAQALCGAVPSGVIGTLGWGSLVHLEPTEHTTPNALEMHRMLAAMRDSGYHAVAIEASSHGQVQGRLNGIRIKTALYTNFSRDHLDYHGDMQAYQEAKLGLLDAPGLESVVFNADDAMAAAILSRKKTALQAVGFSTQHPNNGQSFPLLTASDLRQDVEGLSFTAHYRQQSVGVQVPVFGCFNQQNILATMAVLLGMGYSLSDAATAVHRVRPVSGRMEHYFGQGRNVVVDYAHSPDALKNVLESLRPLCKGHLWLVFGCGRSARADRRQPQDGKRR